MRVPGSKSQTNRALLLAALASGRSRITHALHAEDTSRLAAALTTLGATTRAEGEDFVVEGVSGRLPRGGRVDLHDGGTPARFMLAAALLAAEPVEVDGSARLRERPMAEGLALTRAMGAAVTCLGAPDHLPVRISPPASVEIRTLSVGRTRSSQFISALLLIAPALPHGLCIRLEGEMTSASYVALTLDVLRQWGARVERDAGEIRVSPGIPDGREYEIEADASSAIYFALAAAQQPGSCVRLEGIALDSNQPDAALIRRLSETGALVRDMPGERAIEVRGGAERRAVCFDASDAPDGALAWAAFALRCRGVTRLTGLHTLRDKESDRLSALRTELERLGAHVETTADSITIDPSSCHDRPVTIADYNDHRIAMAMAVAALPRGAVRITNPACVTKSYPGFWRDLHALREVRR